MQQIITGTNFKGYAFKSDNGCVSLVLSDKLYDPDKLDIFEAEGFSSLSWLLADDAAGSKKIVGVDITDADDTDMHDLFEAAIGNVLPWDKDELRASLSSCVKMS